LDKAEVIKKLKEYKILLFKHLKFDELILFGSYAKGTANQNTAGQNNLDLSVNNQISIVEPPELPFNIVLIRQFPLRADGFYFFDFRCGDFCRAMNT